MDICKGMLVYSRAGRDKGRLFAVTEVDGNFVYLSDGDTRSLKNPKKKKIRHINRTNTVLNLDFDKISDSDLRKTLSGYSA